jgi:hypothetical protein
VLIGGLLAKNNNIQWKVLEGMVDISHRARGGKVYNLSWELFDVCDDRKEGGGEGLWNRRAANLAHRIPLPLLKLTTQRREDCHSLKCVLLLQAPDKIIKTMLIFR